MSYFGNVYLRPELANATGSLDLALSLFGEVASSDDDGLRGHDALTEDLEVTGLNNIDDGGLISAINEGSLELLGDEGPQLLNVHSLAVISVSAEVEVPHTDLTEITGVVLVEVDSVVMLTTGLTATSRMLSVLTDTTVTVRNVTTHLAGFLAASGHLRPLA